MLIDSEFLQRWLTTCNVYQLVPLIPMLFEEMLNLNRSWQSHQSLYANILQ